VSRQFSTEVFVNEREERDRELFNRISPAYARKDMVSYSRVARRLRLRCSLRNLKKPIGSLLEVGCGAGFTAEYLRGELDSYTGLDYSEELIAFARGRHRFRDSEFICGNILEFDERRTFDVILMIGVLHHMPSPENVLERLRGRLAPGGVVIVNEPQNGNPVIGLLRVLRKKLDPNYSSDQVEFSRTELLRLFEGSGYAAKSFSQGVFSTPLAETVVLPRVIGLPLAWLSVIVDPLFERLFDRLRLTGLCWNVVVEGRAAEVQLAATVPTR